MSKKPSVIRAPNFLQAKNHFLSKTLKNPKGGPFSVKKFFVSDFAQISCVEFLGPKYVSFFHQNLSQNFFWLRRVPPLYFSVFNLKSSFLPTKTLQLWWQMVFWQILIGITCIYSEKLTDLLIFFVYIKKCYNTLWVSWTPWAWICYETFKSWEYSVKIRKVLPKLN